jgi:hypothetical protein
MVTEILLAYIIGFITGSAIKGETEFWKRVSIIIVMTLMGFGIYYLLILIGIK